MSNYIIKITNTSSEIGTIIPDVGFSYTDNLNEVNQANIKLSGSSSAKRSLIEMGSIVEIYRGGTLEFKGLIDSVDYLSAGGMSIKSSGWEIWLGKENGDYASSPWSSTASATIFSAVLAEMSQPASSPFTEGTVDAGTSIDFRAGLTESIWNIISNLSNKTTQDIGIDYINQEIDILDHKGSSTSVATFNTGIQISNLRVTQTYPLGNDVRIYGQGEGETRIISDHTSSGQDATSKTNYGTIRKIVRDPSITTVAEADLLADALVAYYKDPIKIYDFEVLNPSQSIVSGDVITLNAPSQGLSSEDVRVVKIKKGMQGNREVLTYQVTNEAYSRAIKNKDEVLAQIDKNNRDNQTYNQYQSEYSNQTCATTIGGTSCFTNDLACIFGSCMTASIVNLLDLGLIGNGVCGCTGDWLFLNGSLSVTSGTVQACKLNVNVSSACNYICDGLIVAGALTIGNSPDEFTFPTFDGNAGNFICTDGSGALGWATPAAGSDLWADGTAPYVIPCNSCGICMTGNIVSANNTSCMGCAASPGSWKEVHGLCIVAGTCVVSGVVQATYLNGTCVCGSRRMVLPVGVNCY